MRRFIMLVSAVTAATLLVVACSSSSDSGSSSTGGSGGTGGGSNAQCVGVYANLTQSAFTAKLSSAGKCIGSSDVNAICSNDVTKAAEDCGGSCFKMGGDSATQDACTSTCLSAMVTPALSADCLGCYVTDVGCARTNCLVQCGIAPTSQACADCRDKHGCASGFYSCSGVPVPSGGGSGGTGGSGGGPAMGAAGEAPASAGAGG